MQVAADRRCFICGPDNPIGLHVNFQIDPDNNKAEAKLTLSANHQGWQGVVHGGIISALLDEAAIYACRPISLQAVTSALSVRFRKPVPTGVEIVVRAEVVKVRRKLAIVTSTLTCGGEVLAEAEVKIMLTDESMEGLS